MNQRNVDALAELLDEADTGLVHTDRVAEFLDGRGVVAKPDVDAALGVLLPELPAILRQDEIQASHWRAVVERMLGGV